VVPQTGSADGALSDHERDAGPGTARQTLISRSTNLFVRLVLAVLVVVVLALAGTGAVTATSSAVQSFDPSRLTSERQRHRQFETIRSELAAQVPAGSRVSMTRISPSSEWQQRIVEFATMYDITVVNDPQQANFALAVVGTPDATSSGGLHLDVTPVR
jgi:hypothetical protein